MMLRTISAQLSRVALLSTATLAACHVGGDEAAAVDAGDELGVIASHTGYYFVDAWLWTGSFNDVFGWNDELLANSIRLGDVDGDNRADVCARTWNGIHCGLSTGFNAFRTVTHWESSYSDANGWRHLQHVNSIQLGDVNGDNKDDVCGRSAHGMVCSLSTGSSFGAMTAWDTYFTSASGWWEPEHANTIRLGDVNGDGKDDACGRSVHGVVCAVSTGSSFAPPKLWDSVFSDANGWGNTIYANSIQLADVNGDGRDDLCGRGGGGINCALSTGSSFTRPTLWNADFRDGNGWNVPQYANTIRLADIDGDRRADVCGRGAGGINCALSNGMGFARARLWTAKFNDADGWASSPGYYNTIMLGDLTNDGRADVCGRGGGGINCGLSLRHVDPPPPQAICGDGVCVSGETCSSCASDCGSCNSCPASFGTCGIGCPAGFHPVAYRFDSACGTQVQYENHTTCFPDCGTSFRQCGSSCPTGYHVVSRLFDSACRQWWQQGLGDNAVNCYRN